ncbi:MAG TPA: hypothetical protein VKD28_11930 [Gemmatimonadales bacterium]|nr:hypothetical protein [Gemmatimonadales bacterium]
MKAHRTPKKSGLSKTVAKQISRSAAEIGVGGVGGVTARLFFMSWRRTAS